MDFIVLFIAGIFIGSFLNVLVDRLPRQESIIVGRSHCDKCKKKLAWFDLIPLLSFVLLEGKCRCCKVKLSLYYPIIELTTGILFAATAFFVLNNFQSALNFQSLIPLVYYLFVVSCLIVVFFADLKYGIIPDRIVFLAILISFPYLMWGMNYLIFPYLFSAAGAFLFFLFLFLITRGRGMGFGDVKFAFLMGLILGFPNIIVSLYIAFLTGAIVGCILIVCGKKKTFGASIPFGPFLAIGTLAAIFWGENLVQSFFRLASL